MSVHNKLRFLLAVVPCLLVGMAHAATVATESEPGVANDPIGNAQPLSALGGVSVNGELGNGAGSGLDFYKFWANAGDTVIIKINNGFTGTDPANDIDTVIGLFDDSANHYLITQNDNPKTINSGSTSIDDARIDNWTAPNTGYYIVGVAATTPFPPLLFQDGGTISVTNNVTQGTYTLIITGATANAPVDSGPPPPKQVAVVIKPGYHGFWHMNRRGLGTMRVAIISGPGFDAMSVDTSTLTFGSTGDEHSLAKCNSFGVDVNDDGLPDLLCRFRVKAANFQPTDSEGIVRGKFGPEGNEAAFEGKGYLKVVPAKRSYGRHHERRDSRGHHDRHHDRH